MDSVTGQDNTTAVGADILGLVTSGMYVEPLAVYREYIQNAVDAIQSGGLGEDGLVEIGLAPDEGRVAIRDNGPGLSLTEAKKTLVPIAKSEKRGRGLRGFRGVGRLAGLAFAESVTFLSRAGEGAPVVRVVWDGSALNAGIKNGDGLRSVLWKAVTVDTVRGDGYPARFFEARMDGVSRHAAGRIMNRDAVRQYVGEVCPVPFAQEFRYAAEIGKILGSGDTPFTVGVRFEDEDKSVERPHRCGVRVSERESQEIVEIEEIRIAGVGTRECAAIGWIAHTSYRGAMPQSCGVRGIRARVGNMQIGGESVFEHLFSEDRFNRWCIGEIHVLESAIVPNARRDYFEPGVHLRNLENQLSAVCRRLERRCRSASKERLRDRRLGDFVEEAEGTLELASSGYLDMDASRKLIEDTIVQALHWGEKPLTHSGNEPVRSALKRVTAKLNGFQAHVGTKRFPGVGTMETRVYREVFGVLTEVLSRPELAKRMIEVILDRMQERRSSKAV